MTNVLYENLLGLVMIIMFILKNKYQNFNC